MAGKPRVPRKSSTPTQRSPRMAEVVSLLRSSKTKASRDAALETFQGLISRRLSVLMKSYGLTGLKRWDHMIASYRDDIDSLLDLEEIQVIIRPAIEAALVLGTKHGMTCKCVCTDSYDLLDVLVRPNRLILRNPFSGAVESWARPFAAEGLLYHSYPAVPTADKSVFLKGKDHWAICLETFQAPKGRFVGAKKLYLYKRFDRSIGKLAGGGKQTKFVRIQCDRVNRPQGGGYRTQVHGYPLSDAEVKRDLGKCQAVLSQL